MKRETIIIATIRPWNLANARFLSSRLAGYKTVIVNGDRELRAAVRRERPRYIFFPHWSLKIPEEIFRRFECVVFHMTDLPFGRGGSPLQNLICRRITKTRICALRVTGEIDAGPVYMKKTLSLSGSAGDIYRRASTIIFKSMIPDMLKRRPSPQPQQGKPVFFKRRTPRQSLIPAACDSIERIYDHIRMLDAEGYPPAFLEAGKLRFEFTGASLRDGALHARVRIQKRN